jgi:hypothetical protein
MVKSLRIFKGKTMPDIFSAENSSGAEEEKTEVKRPEFIIIDERDGTTQKTYYSSEYSWQPVKYVETRKEEVKSSSVSLRFLCFLGLVFCVIFGTGIFLLSLVLTFLSLVNLFQNKNLNEGAWSFWKLWISTVIISLAFIIGLIVPTIGVGLIVFYFSLIGGKSEDNFLHKIFRQTFHQ